MSKLIIGIDPGVKTGLAVWDTKRKELLEVSTYSIIEAFEGVREWEGVSKIKLFFEDSRLRKGYFGKNPEAKLQGAGSIKRDCKIWQEFCEYYGIEFEAVKPAKGQTKWTAEYFKTVTGYKNRTSQHSRDAAVLVFGL